MRCKCCNSSNTKFILGDFYCTTCSSEIWKTIKEDRLRCGQEEFIPHDKKNEE